MIAAIGRWAFWVVVVLFWAAVETLVHAGVGYLVEGNVLHALFDWTVALVPVGVWWVLRHHLPSLTRTQRKAAIIVLAFWIGLSLLSFVY